MFRVASSLFIGVLLWGSALCINKCPDGNYCNDFTTCCKTPYGYSCCPYPQAVCCSDLAHCCPSGFMCNIAQQTCVKANEPWMKVPMVMKEAAIKPSKLNLPIIPFEEIKSQDLQEQQKASVVYCDNYYFCPDGTTCCRHPNQAWFCCPYSPGQCCVDGFHCCPRGYNCDWTFQHCVRQNQRYPFLVKDARPSFPALPKSPSEDEDGMPEAADTHLS